MVTLVAHTTPWHLVCFFFTRWMLWALTAPVLVAGRDKALNTIGPPPTAVTTDGGAAGARRYSLLIRLHVEADFVSGVQVHVPLDVVRRVGQVEHFLWRGEGVRTQPGRNGASQMGVSTP